MTSPPSANGSRIPQEGRELPDSEEQKHGEHVAYLATLDASVLCKTASDALLASFFFGWHGPRSSRPSSAHAGGVSAHLKREGRELDFDLIDEILTLIHTHSFDPGEVTWSSALDMQRYVVEERRKAAERRTASMSRRSAPSRSQVPPVVIDLVAQQLASEMQSLARQVDWDAHVFFGQSHVLWGTSCRQTDLRAMALVNRTWTEPATRALRSRVYIQGETGLNRLATSPRVGPWIREVYFRSSTDPYGRWEEDVGATIRQLGRFLKQTPHVRELAVRTGNTRVLSGEALEDTFRGFIDALKGMQELERLWLIQDQGTVACLPSLCEALSRLPKLRQVDIRNWTQGPGEGPHLDARMALLFAELPSPTRITTLSIAHGGMHEITQQLVTWLLRSDPSKSALKHLEIHSKDFLFGTGTVRPLDLEGEPQPWPLHRALEPFMPRVETLRIHCAPIGIGTMLGIVRAARNVKKLSIVGAPGFTHFATTPGTLSDSIELLHLHFSIYPATALRLRQSLANEEFMPRLRSLRLTKDPLRFDADVVVGEDRVFPTGDWQIDEVRHLCKGRNVTVKNDYTFLTFDELCDMPFD